MSLDSVQAPLSCLLCGSKRVRFACVFVPSARLRLQLGEPPGKVRLISYNLCCKCRRLRRVFAQVEAKLLAEVAAAAGQN